MAPEEIAYVGDRTDNDVLPAADAGMRPILIRRGPWDISMRAAPRRLGRRSSIRCSSCPGCWVALPSGSLRPSAITQPTDLRIADRLRHDPARPSTVGRLGISKAHHYAELSKNMLRLWVFQAATSRRMVRRLWPGVAVDVDQPLPVE